MNEGQRLKQLGQDAVLKKENAEWRERALALMAEFARLKHRFHADQFREWVLGEKAVPEPHHPNVWGALYTTAARKYWIRRSGDYSQSQNPAAHAHTCSWWESLIYEGPPVAQRPARPGVRYQIRAPKKVGLTVDTATKAKSAEIIRFYCETFRADAATLTFTEMTPGANF